MTTSKQKTNVADVPQVAVESKDFLTAKEAANYIGASLNYFYKLTSANKLPMYNPTGRRLLFKRSELRAWVESFRVSSRAELAEKAELELLKKEARL